MSDIENRRKSSRYRVTIELDLAVPALDLTTTVVTRDLSKGGLCFSLDRALALGEVLHLGMSLVLGPDTFSQPLSMEAGVAWCSKEGPECFQIGAAFNDLTDEKLENISTFLEFIREGFEYNEPS